MTAHRTALAVMAVAVSVGTSTCAGITHADATSAGGTYVCFDGHVATEVVVHGKTLTPNFDAAQYTAPDGQVKAVHRLPDGTVPDLVFDFDGALAGPIVFAPHYTGPNGADSHTPLVVAHIDGDLPNCTPATTVAPTTSTSPPTTSPKASTTTSPASSTTTRPPASSVPPGSTTASTSPSSLPATGGNLPRPLVAGAFAGLLFGGLCIGLTRRPRGQR